jgi:uncharacterized protein (TIGR03437 family)
MRAKRCVALISFLLPLAANGQPVATGAGYEPPLPIAVAPGQVITLYVRIPGKTAATAATAQPPLPATLGGFSVLLRQTFPSDPVAVPLLSVADAQPCSALTPVQCDVVTMLTVQIPYELSPNGSGSLLPANSARLEIAYNGGAPAYLLLSPVVDRVHVLNSCDVASPYRTGICGPVVAHADGALVDYLHPAQAGETLTMSLVGLGAADRPVATGAAAPDSAPSVSNLRVTIDARANAAPAQPAAGVSAADGAARLRPGAVGIYELTFRAPSLPAGAPPCGGDVRSNATVSVGAAASFDGAAICVDPAGGTQGTPAGRLPRGR